MYKINLHAHSKFSDGGGTIDEMVREYKEQGFIAAVITDHVYSRFSPISLNLPKLYRARTEALEASIKYNIPVFIGAEFSVSQAEEVVVIGKYAVEWLLTIQNDRALRRKPMTITVGDLMRARKRFKCFMSLCHPHLPTYETVGNALGGTPKFFQLNGHRAIDAYEIVNGGSWWWRNRDCPEELKNVRLVANSDAHSPGCLRRAYNLVDEPLETEEALIHYFKDPENRVQIASSADFHGNLLNEDMILDPKEHPEILERKLRGI